LVPSRYAPFSQLAQSSAASFDVSLDAITNLPFAHEVHDAEPAPPHLPSGQTTHCVRAAPLYLPAGQRLHKVLPAAAWNLPSSQFLHEPPVDSWYFPGEQSVHPVDGMLAEAYVPFAQGAQDPADPCSLNRPSGQLLQLLFPGDEDSFVSVRTVDEDSSPGLRLNAYVGLRENNAG
jgi:hypothetical protein